MRVIADICITPMGVGASVSDYVTEAHAILKDAGLNATLHAYGTNVEGEFDAVMSALKRCHERLHELGAPRLSTSIRLGTRIDKPQTMNDKVNVVRDKLAHRA
ncbi:MAG: MTH1187 family thiamine-binding protein [Candidatus Poribacteria bacterium]|nr:MTH1187 family thiamine-binding protein [Candidatus Poribacteria bacterium]